MAKKKTEEKTVHRPADPNVMGLRGAVVEQPITRTLDNAAASPSTQRPATSRLCTPDGVIAASGT